eukprot:scaffold1724_cov246-Pinguiococcus_pyrenoidosus.AAC.14
MNWSMSRPRSELRHRNQKRIKATRDTSVERTMLTRTFIDVSDATASNSGMADRTPDPVAT